MQTGPFEHCTCIYHSPTPTLGGTGKQSNTTEKATGTETGRSFNQYLAPLLTGMLYPSSMQSGGGLSSGNLASLLPLFMLSSNLSPFSSFNGMSNSYNSPLSLLPLLMSTGMGSAAYAQPYSRYLSPVVSSQLQPNSRINLTL